MVKVFPRKDTIIPKGNALIHEFFYFLRQLKFVNCGSLPLFLLYFLNARQVLYRL